MDCRWQRQQWSTAVAVVCVAVVAVVRGAIATGAAPEEGTEGRERPLWVERARRARGAERRKEEMEEGDDDLGENECAQNMQKSCTRPRRYDTSGFWSWFNGEVGFLRC